MTLRLDLVFIFVLLVLYFLGGLGFNNSVILFLAGISADIATIRARQAEND